ncbi:MAG: AraC family transcriptional regulator ligand-binding domain-containing protein [Pseudomonadota bacterium]
MLPCISRLDLSGPLFDNFGHIKNSQRHNMHASRLSATKQGMPAQWLIAYLQKHGVGTEEICSAVGVDKNSLISTTGIMATSTYLEVFNWAAQQLKDPLLGVHAADDIKPGEFGLLDHLIRNGPSLRESFDFTQKYHCIFSPDFDYRFSYAGNKGICHYQEANLPGADSTQDINFGFALVINIIRERFSPIWQPLRTCFVYPQPADISAHQNYFGDAIFFNQSENLLDFEEDIVDIPNERADPNLLPILLNQANQLLDEQKTQTDVVRQVSLLITTSLGYRSMSSEAVADRLHVSVRQLHRRLSQQNTSFRQIKEDTVLRVAKEALANSDMSVTEIAMKLNYSETSAFDRMFKKMERISPLQYRKKYSRL